MQLLPSSGCFFGPFSRSVTEHHAGHHISLHILDEQAGLGNAIFLPDQTDRLLHIFLCVAFSAALFHPLLYSLCGRGPAEVFCGVTFSFYFSQLPDVKTFFGWGEVPCEIEGKELNMPVIQCKNL